MSVKFTAIVFSPTLQERFLGEVIVQLELHDSEAGNTLTARVNNIDYDYQAEQWVQDTFTDHPEVVKWVLLDGDGVRCVWERPQGSLEIPNITQRSRRFQGEWEKGPTEITI